MRTVQRRFARGGRQGLGGFTLAEALLASVVLAVVSAAASLPILAAAENAREAERLRYATEMGQALIDEILARPLVDTRVGDRTLGPSAAETSRKAYVNVDAFNGLTESSLKPADYTGAAVGDATVQGFWRAATVKYVSFAGQPAGDTAGFALIQVEVFYQTTLMVTFTRLVAAEG